MARSSEKKRAYYQAHREEILAKRALYRAANREVIRVKKAAVYRAQRAEILAKLAAYRAEHREEERAYYTTYRAAHRAAMLKNQELYNATHLAERKAYRVSRRAEKRAYDQAYNAANRDERRAMAVAWIKAHPEEMASHYRRRRARKLNAPVCDFTKAQWEDMKASYGYRCVYCPPECPACERKTHRLTQDHITPLSQGGSHTLQNIVPCCARCNSKKHAGPVLVPVQPLLL